jgi:hypothetical protein
MIMTGSMKTIITLAVAMNVFCFAAMVAPDALDAMGGFSPYPFLAMLLMTLPLLAFGVVTLCRLARRRRNAWFFLKTSAVSQLIVALMALLLVIIMEVEDGGSENFSSTLPNALCHIWLWRKGGGDGKN